MKDVRRFTSKGAATAWMLTLYMRGAPYTFKRIKVDDKFQYIVREIHHPSVV